MMSPSDVWDSSGFWFQLGGKNSVIDFLLEIVQMFSDHICEVDTNSDVLLDATDDIYSYSYFQSLCFIDLTSNYLYL